MHQPSAPSPLLLHTLTPTRRSATARPTTGSSRGWRRASGATICPKCCSTCCLLSGSPPPPTWRGSRTRTLRLRRPAARPRQVARRRVARSTAPSRLMPSGRPRFLAWVPPGTQGTPGVHRAPFEQACMSELRDGCATRNQLFWGGESSSLVYLYFCPLPPLHGLHTTSEHPRS